MYSRAFDEAKPLQVPGNYAGTAFEKEAPFPPCEDEEPRKEPEPEENCEETFAPRRDPPKRREEKRHGGDGDMLLLLLAFFLLGDGKEDDLSTVLLLLLLLQG